MGKISCDSCGKVLHNNGIVDPKTDNEYCRDCVRDGKLKSYDEIKEYLVKFYIKFYNYSRKVSERFVSDKLKQMPAWEKRGKW